ncbi:acyltransferase family protein [Mycobacterium sp.]|uniref:acyltransferase family protein n=1 Tax=Mycobacterium sp. TaxID=1785 RepID=UPI0031E451AC
MEGLRAVAVVAVVLFHAQVPGVGGGFVGVDVFFVISGFLITGLLWRETSTTGTVKLSRFYGARARRLLPASATVGVITMIASALLLPPLQVRNVLCDGITSALYVGNYWFIAEGVHYFGGHLPPSPFQHYWSLGVEEQFYLVWPPLIIGTAWLIRRARRRSGARAISRVRPYLVMLALVAAVSFALSLAVTYVMPAAAFFSLPTRAWQLAVGGLVALTAGQWRRLPALPAATAGLAGLALILLACNRFGTGTPYPGIAALVPTLGAVLVIGAGCGAPSQGCGRVLGLSPMRAIGRISYSWYLWHWPVLVLTPVLLGHPVGLAVRLGAALLSGGLAVLTMRLVENPLRFAAALRRSALASLALGGAATAVAVCVGVVLLVVAPTPVGRGAPATALTITSAPPPAGSAMGAYDAAVQHAFAQVQAAVTASAALNAVPSNLNPPLADAAAEQNAYSFDGCLRTPFEAGQPQCATGDTASATTVAVVGDSHAAMWNPAFRQIAERRHWRLEMLGKGACPPMDLPIANHLVQLVEHLEHCQQWRAQIIARLRAEQPRLIVVSMWRGYSAGNGSGWLSGFTSYDPAWIDGLTRLVQQLRGTGAQVLVLGPIPDPHSQVPICLSGHLDDASACSPPRSTAVNDPGIAAETAATHAGGGHYANITDLFCTAESCPVIVGNTLVYFDWEHLTLEYSRLLAPAIGALADRALARD